MEETWELAAVSEYKDRHEDDWSGRHVRIRFEMVLSAVIFFIVAKYGATEVRLPIIGLKSEIKDDFLMWAALFFSMFSIAALLTRSHYEKMKWPKEELSTKKEIEAFSKDFQEIQNSSNSLVKDLSGDPKRTIEQLFDFQDDIQNFNNKTNRFLGFLSDLHLENGLESPVHPKFWAKVVSIMSSVNLASNDILKQSKNASALKNSGSSFSDSYAASVRINLSENCSKLVEGFQVLEPEIIERKKALLWTAFTKVFQRELLSYGLPILTAVLLIISGLYCRFCGCSV